MIGSASSTSSRRLAVAVQAVCPTSGTTGLGQGFQAADVWQGSGASVPDPDVLIRDPGVVRPTSPGSLPALPPSGAGSFAVPVGCPNRPAGAVLEVAS